MLVVMLGSPASASTWLFNVVRQLFERSGSSVFALSADDGLDALDQMPLHVSNVIVKAHSMDQRLMRIASLASAKLIISTRDPLDSAVSQQKRFGLSAQRTAIDLTRSFASIESLPSHMPCLTLRYEDRFMDHIETIDRLARYLGIVAASDDVALIFDKLRPDAVRASIQSRIDALPAGTLITHDPETHWHPDHVGDGEVGKWREQLGEPDQDAFVGCLTPLASHRAWQNDAVHWSGRFFQYDGGEKQQRSVDLKCDGTSRALVHGPYLHLPRGRWRATPIVEAASRWREVHLAVDVFKPNVGCEPIVRQGSVRKRTTCGLSIEFDHDDHFQPIEIRLKSVAESHGDIRFSGCSLRCLGPCI